MNNPTAQDACQRGSAGSMSGQVPGPPSVEATRALILQSRAIGEIEARRAAAIDGLTSHSPPQAQEDAFSLPPRATSVGPAERT